MKVFKSSFIILCYYYNTSMDLLDELMIRDKDIYLNSISSKNIYFNDLTGKNRLYIANVDRDGNCFFESFRRMYNILSKITQNNKQFKSQYYTREYVEQNIDNIRELYKDYDFSELKKSIIQNGHYDFDFLPIIYMLSKKLDIIIRIFIPNENKKCFNCQIFNEKSKNFKIDLLLHNEHYQNIIDSNQLDIISMHLNKKIKIKTEYKIYVGGYIFTEIINFNEIHENVLSYEKKIESEINNKFKQQQSEILNNIIRDNKCNRNNEDILNYIYNNIQNNKEEEEDNIIELILENKRKKEEEEINNIMNKLFI
jgi:hypothetical protein